MKLETSDLTFLARFARSPDGQVLLKLLRAELSSLDDELRVATGEHLVRTQGKAQQVDALIKAILDAETRLNRAAASPRRRFVVDTEDPLINA